MSVREVKSGSVLLLIWFPYVILETHFLVP